MANNILLYNAALNGFLSGALAGAFQTDPVQGDYTTIVSQAVIFATAMDAAIPNDNVGASQPVGTAAISVIGTGVAITGGGTSALVEGQAIKPQLLQMLCFGFAFQRYATGTAPTYTTAIAAIKAIYFQTLLSGLYT